MSEGRNSRLARPSGPRLFLGAAFVLGTPSAVGGLDPSRRAVGKAL